MSTNISSRINVLAYELAKNDVNFKKDKDANDQKKLNQILINSSIYEEKIEMQIKQIINDLGRNPNFEVTNTTKEDILVVLEQHLIMGNLESISQIDDREFISIAVTNRVIEDDRAYKEDVSTMLENYKLRGEELEFSTYMISRLMNGDLSEEKINNLMKILENSEEFKEKGVNSVDAILNGTEEEKEKGGMYLSARDAGGDGQYFKEHKHDKKAMRGAIFIVLRNASSGSPELLQQAVLKAAQFGLNDLIKPDGSIDYDKAFDRYKDAIAGDERLMARFPTKERLMQEVEDANARGAQNVRKQYLKDKKFAERWNACKTPEEKDKLLSERKKSIKMENEIIRSITTLISRNDTERVKEKIASLVGSDRENMEEMLLKIAKTGKSAIKNELTEYITRSFEQKENSNERDSSNREH